MFKQALLLNPHSAIGMAEYASALMMIDGEKRMAEAERLLAEAAAIEPMDAAERLDVESSAAEAWPAAAQAGAASRSTVR